MRESRSSGSVEGVMRNRDPYSDWRRGLPRLKSETASGFTGRQSLRAKFFTTGNTENTGKHREKHGDPLLELTIHSPSFSSPAATRLLPPARQKCPAKLPET